MLDTWFSSALWPFATLGWPEDTPDLRRFYPGDFNITAREIIRLWENRMIFSGLELVGDIPFDDVIIHSTVLALDGRRMSKSLGNGIDPLEVIAEYSSDATRYGLMKMSSTQDVRFSYKAIEEGRRLAIKLWNVSRLILQNTEGVSAAAAPRDLEERWILARIDRVRAEVEEGLAGFDFAAVVDALYHLTYDDFCDWYAEAIKPRLYEDDADAAATALEALTRLLALLHPVRAARHGGDLDADSGSRGASHRVAVAGGGRALRGRRAARSTACRELRASSAAAVSRRRSGRTTSGASSRRSCGRSERAWTAIAKPRSSGCGARSRAPRACSRTSASCRTRRPRSCRASARSSSATAASSRTSAADRYPPTRRMKSTTIFFTAGSAIRSTPCQWLGWITSRLSRDFAAR